MKLLLPLLLAATCFSVSALDIKGIKVDRPVDCEAIKKLETRGGNWDACTAGRAQWYVQARFLSGTTMLRVALSPEKEVMSVLVGEFGTFNFQEALDALTVKYGPPSSVQNGDIKSRAGVSFPQMEATWVDGAERLVLTKHGAAIDRPTLLYIGSKAETQVQLEREAKAKKAAGNL